MSSNGSKSSLSKGVKGRGHSGKEHWNNENQVAVEKNTETESKSSTYLSTPEGHGREVVPLNDTQDKQQDKQLQKAADKSIESLHDQSCRPKRGKQPGKPSQEHSHEGPSNKSDTANPTTSHVHEYNETATGQPVYLVMGPLAYVHSSHQTTMTLSIQDTIEDTLNRNTQEPEPTKVEETEALSEAEYELESNLQKEVQIGGDQFKGPSVKDKAGKPIEEYKAKGAMKTKMESATLDKKYKPADDSSGKKCEPHAEKDKPQQLPAPNSGMSGGSPRDRDKFSFIKSHCRKELNTKPEIYIANTKESFNDKENKIRKVEFGGKKQTSPEKVVMLVGATGAGKSTMINAVFNYMSGIEWENEYRLKLIEEDSEVNQAVSQTDTITAYTIHHQPWFRVSYTITLIDTPGFGDTGGLKRDQQTVDQIKKFFMTKGPNGIDHLDAVGFVTQSSLPRLSPIQRYIFDSILSIFGKDIAQNIFMLLTFADGQKPQVLSGLKEAKMEYKSFYKFNNSALYVSNKKEERHDMGSYNEEEEEYADDEEDDDGNRFHKMFWEMGAGNFNKFMNDLEGIQPKSLVLTSKVLEERNELQITMNQIHDHIKIGLKKLKQLKMERKVMKQHQADIENSRNFTYEANEPRLQRVRTARGEYAINCTCCKMTCRNFYLGPRMPVEGIRLSGGNCGLCPGKCSFSKHQCNKEEYMTAYEEVTKTSVELKRRYEEAEGKKLSAKQLIEKCSEEFERVQIATLDLTEQARKCLKRLNEIALKPNPLSTTDYIDLMIQEEEFMAGPGWKETVNQLGELKTQIDFIQQLTEEEYDPFAAQIPQTKPKHNSQVVTEMNKNVKRQAAEPANTLESTDL